LIQNARLKTWFCLACKIKLLRADPGDLPAGRSDALAFQRILEILRYIIGGKSSMPSFDIVSQTDMQEMDNAVNQTRKEISTRYDFKGSKAGIELADDKITVVGDDDYKLEAVMEILRGKLVRRGLDPRCLDYGTVEDASGGTRRQVVDIKQGVSQDLAKQIVKQIKQEKMKVQAAIQGDQVRVTGKKRDDLQAVIALVKGMDTDRPLNYINFRD
jgi:uncharacterized protein YajQ (UPF0234 family)